MGRKILDVRGTSFQRKRLSRVNTLPIGSLLIGFLQFRANDEDLYIIVHIYCIYIIYYNDEDLYIIVQ